MGVGLTAFGRLPDEQTLDLMGRAADDALADAGVDVGEVDALLCGYSTTMPHLMLATVFAEHHGLRVGIARSLQLGGATGGALLATADALVRSGDARRVLVVAGENRLTGQARARTVETLAQVGHPTKEVALGLTVPAFYALLASAYVAHRPEGERGLAELAVLMRANAARHDGAHLRAPITVGEALASPPICDPLKLIDCCPISDGAAALVVASEPGRKHAVRILGTGEAHKHQYLSSTTSLSRFGAKEASDAALRVAGVERTSIDLLAIYDSFTVTLALLLEELQFSDPGAAGADAAAGRFAIDGPLPLNPHGGLLSYGHCGVAGGMSHIVEACVQLTGRAEGRAVRTPECAMVHVDGGVLSSHITAILGDAR